MLKKLALFLFLLDSNLALANDGQVDVTFGTAGVAQLGLNDIVLSSGNLPPAVQPDGKVLICVSQTTSGSSGQDFVIARFTPDGQLDSTFNFDGIVRVDFADQKDYCGGIALQSDGKIVVAGTTYAPPEGTSQIAVARLMTDGTRDASFGVAGKVSLSYQSNAPVNQVNALVIQPDQKIVVAGDSQLAGIQSFAAARLNADGSNDATFNLTGTCNFTFVDKPSSGNFDTATAVAIDSGGNLVLAGQTKKIGGTSTDFDFAIARLTPSGALDSNFNANGKLTVPFDLGGASGSNNDGVAAVLIATNGDILVAGAADEGTPTVSRDVPVLVRLLPNGDFVDSFGSHGKLALPLPPQANTAIALSLIEQENGKVVVGGYAANAQNQYVVSTAVRLNVDGSLDPEFGTLGMQALALGGGSIFAGLAFQGTQIIAVGELSANFFVTDDAFIVRLQSDLIFADGL